MNLNLRSFFVVSSALVLISFFSCKENSTGSQGTNITTNVSAVNHTSTDLSLIPAQWIDSAKSKFKIAYGHTSHGSQIVTGMEALVVVHGDKYSFNSNGSHGALTLKDTPFSGASDLGNPDFTAWAAATRTYLDSHTDINVVMWSWCGQVSSTDSSDIVTYLELMSSLETEYPSVHFVYMTGHLDGTGNDGNLNKRNQQIRNFCSANKKVLFDFADIESYCPDGTTNYMTLMANDNCDYETDSTSGNWAQEWIAQNSSSELAQEAAAVCSGCCAHSQGLNCARKARAFWWMLTCLAGWTGS